MATNAHVIAFVADSNLRVRAVFVQRTKNKDNNADSLNKLILEDLERVAVRWISGGLCTYLLINIVLLICMWMRECYGKCTNWGNGGSVVA
ncbi:hypothetical protein T05_1133 [Trichinella murrelli]|uniref:Uncharacterized protein n=1 Tax=Trichinella murrelli TaxID=144512 RepID=A0A0V0SVF6_9BILA|nr:hypothetical protein T05_1133 [Trichinella murrelli]